MKSQCTATLSAIILLSFSICVSSFSAPILDYQMPVYRVEITPGAWDVDKIQYEAGLRDIPIDVIETENGTQCVTELNCEYTEVYKLRDRMKLAGFDAAMKTEIVDYEEAKQQEMFPLEAFATNMDLGEYKALPDTVAIEEINNIETEFKAFENQPDITTQALVDFLKGKMPALLYQSEKGNPKATYLIGSYYYLRGLAETKKRMENYQQVGFRLQQFEPVTSEENRSYLTALQYYQSCAKQKSPLQEKALYHCAASLYGIRNVGDKLVRIPQSLNAYETYVTKYPEGKWAKRAAMNIVGLEFVIHRLNRDHPIEPALTLAQEILFEGKDANTLGYEELRSALMMMEMLWENGNWEASLTIYNSTFNSINFVNLKESLYSTYSYATEIAASIYRFKMEDNENASILIDNILRNCKKDNHYLMGNAETNMAHLRSTLEFLNNNNN